MERGPWRDTVHGVAKESNMTSQLNSNNNVDYVNIEHRYRVFIFIRISFIIKMYNVLK